MHWLLSLIDIYKKIHSLDEVLQDKMMFPLIIKSFFPEISHHLEESYMDVYNLLRITPSVANDG